MESASPSITRAPWPHGARNSTGALDRKVTVHFVASACASTATNLWDHLKISPILPARIVQEDRVTVHQMSCELEVSQSGSRGRSALPTRKYAPHLGGPALSGSSIQRALVAVNSGKTAVLKSFGALHGVTSSSHSQGFKNSPGILKPYADDDMIRSGSYALFLAFGGNIQRLICIWDYV